eukprot:1674369-Rhodomonas_salina.1
MRCLRTAHRTRTRYVASAQRMRDLSPDTPHTQVRRAVPSAMCSTKCDVQYEVRCAVLRQPMPCARHPVKKGGLELFPCIVLKEKGQQVTLLKAFRVTGLGSPVQQGGTCYLPTRMVVCDVRVGWCGTSGTGKAYGGVSLRVWGRAVCGTEPAYARDACGTEIAYARRRSLYGLRRSVRLRSH